MRSLEVFLSFAIGLLTKDTHSFNDEGAGGGGLLRIALYDVANVNRGRLQRPDG